MNAKTLITISVAMLVALGSTALADKGKNPQSLIVPPQSHFGGKTYAEWVHQYWLWQASFLGDAEEFPGFDLEGKNIQVNQDGPVFFLPFSWTSPWTDAPLDPSAVEQRSARVPAGAGIFCGINGAHWYNPVGGDPSLGWYPKAPTQDPAQFLSDGLEVFAMSQPWANSVEIDGKVIPIDGSVDSPFLTFSAFPLDMPADAAWRQAEWGADAPLIQDISTFYPFVDMIYMVIIKPLPVGQHTVRIRTMDNWRNYGLEYFAMDWNITVTP